MWSIASRTALAMSPDRSRNDCESMALIFTIICGPPSETDCWGSKRGFPIWSRTGRAKLLSMRSVFATSSDTLGGSENAVRGSGAVCLRRNRPAIPSPNVASPKPLPRILGLPPRFPPSRPVRKLCRPSPNRREFFSTARLVECKTRERLRTSLGARSRALCTSTTRRGPCTALALDRPPIGSRALSLPPSCRPLGIVRASRSVSIVRMLRTAAAGDGSRRFPASTSRSNTPISGFLSI